MRINNILFMVGLSVFATFTSCNNDGDKIYLSELEPSDMIATSDNVEITKENKNTYLLGLAWTKNTLVVSDAHMGAPEVVKTIIEVSSSSDFKTTTIQSTESSLGKSYTGVDLNSIAKSLNLPANISSEIYFRLRGSVANNIDPVYSNVVNVKLTPFEIDMTKGYLLNEKQNAMNLYLYSSLSNGIYTGFVNAASWSNYFLQEGDETIWGNDGVSGAAFKLSSSIEAGERWNMWYPDMTGCYYTTVDTKSKEWYTTFVEDVKLVGDINTTLIYDNANVTWKGEVTITESKSYSFTVQVNGILYNYTTGADKGVANSFTLTGDNGVITVKEGNTNQTLDSGTYTVSLNLQKSDAMTYTFTKK